jgi:hypothetical protein
VLEAFLRQGIPTELHFFPEALHGVTPAPFAVVPQR